MENESLNWESKYETLSNSVNEVKAVHKSEIKRLKEELYKNREEIDNLKKPKVRN